MYIKKAVISNYRSVKRDALEIEFAVPDGRPGSGITTIVGANNVGKSNVYHALDLIFNKAGTSNIKNKQRFDDDSEVIVELVDTDFETSIDEYVQENKRQAFKDLVFEESNLKKFKIRRKTTDNVGAIEIWNDSRAEFKNVAGIDAPLQKWLHFLPLWANTTTEEVADYSAKSIIGELLSKIVEEIQSDDSYKKLHEQFESIFGGTDSSMLTQKTASISDAVSKLIKEQFEEVGIKFKAEPPKIEQYVSRIRTLVDDGDETEISEKGNGLQRAIMIALIQVYAQMLSTGESKKPFFLFIDEPELYLNPQAQKILLSALRQISAKEQVFLVTHSPYFIDWEDYTNGARIGKAKRTDQGTEICWLDRPSSYSRLLGNYVSGWQQPQLLDVVSKEILFSEKLLFLEGQEDVGLIRKWSKDNDKKINFDIFGYGVGGFGKFATFIKLASDLGLEKVAVLYDNGSAETAKMQQDTNINISYKLLQLTANDIRDKFESCGVCTECSAHRYNRCTSRTQTKSGGFNESGHGKKGTTEYDDFCTKFEEISTYFQT